MNNIFVGLKEERLLSRMDWLSKGNIWKSLFEIRLRVGYIWTVPSTRPEPEGKQISIYIKGEMPLRSSRAIFRFRPWFSLTFLNFHDEHFAIAIRWLRAESHTHSPSRYSRPGRSGPRTTVHPDMPERPLPTISAGIRSVAFQAELTLSDAACIRGKSAGAFNTNGIDRYNLLSC